MFIYDVLYDQFMTTQINATTYAIALSPAWSERACRRLGGGAGERGCLLQGCACSAPRHSGTNARLEPSDQ